MNYSSNPRLLTLIIVIAGSMYLAIRQVQPPAPVASSAPAVEFSAARAMHHLMVIARKPHPTGSPENARVREYLISQVKAMQLDPQVQTATVVRPQPKRPGPMVAATVNNVVARVKGTSNTKAILLSSHYDSVPTGPGASDDGAGVAALLETLRALKAGGPLRNDVIFLFTDGEEVGLMGAKAFVEEHPWAKDPAVVFNFEARGSCGPSLMFETSPRNGWLVREFAKAIPYPVTSSVFYEVYQRLPNDTDFTIFKNAGLAGLNFAYLGCWPHYHTRKDSVDEIDERSLQHHGSYALALTRHFGNLNLNEKLGNDVTYFSLFGSTVFYSRGWAMILMGLAHLGLMVVIVVGFKRRRLSLHGTSLGSLAWLAGGIISAAFSVLAWVAIRASHLVSLLPYGTAYDSELIAVGFLGVTAAITSAFHLWFLKRTSFQDLAAGGLVWWAASSLLASLYVPGASYLFIWPLLFATATLGLTPTGSNQPSTRRRILALISTAVPGILLAGPLLYLLITTLSTSALAPEAMILTMLLGLFLPYTVAAPARGNWLLSAAAASAGLALVIAGIITSRFDEKRPRPDHILYLLNSDTGKAEWISQDDAPDAWTSQFLGGRIEGGTLRQFFPWPGRVLKSPAPAAGLAAPQLMPLDDLTMGGTRILRLWITSPRQARIASIVVNAQVHAAKVNGKLIPASGTIDRNWGFSYVGIPKEGIVLSFEVNAAEPLVIRVIDASDGLPDIPGTSFKPRPAGFMPAPGKLFDSSSLVIKTYRFEPRP